MNDPIDKQLAITLDVMPKKYRKYQTLNIDDVYDLGWKDCQAAIAKLPTAKERKVGEWRACYHGEHAKTMFSYSCSICGMPSPDNSEWSYCPNCGTRMEGSE